jgi:plasmid stabilization system protein ParE
LPGVRNGSFPDIPANAGMNRQREHIDLHYEAVPRPDTGRGTCVKRAVSGKEAAMPQGDKGKYTDKQKRKAEHIAEGYEDRGVSEKEAEGRAWATVNKESGGGNKSGSGRGRKESHESSRKGGRKGGASQSSSSRSAAAKKGWETRRHKAHG